MNIWVLRSLISVEWPPGAASSAETSQDQQPACLFFRLNKRISSHSLQSLLVPYNPGTQIPPGSYNTSLQWKAGMSLSFMPQELACTWTLGPSWENGFSGGVCMCPQHHSSWPSAKWRKCRGFWNCQRNWFPCQVSSYTVGGPNSTFVLAAMQIKGCWQGAEGFVPGLLQPFLSPAWGMLLAFGFLELSYRSFFVGQQMKGLGNNFEWHNSVRAFLDLQQGGGQEKRRQG